MIARNPQWADPAWWRIIKRESGPFTKSFLLSSFDMQQDEAGRIMAKPAEQSIFLYSLYTTLSISVAVTLICLLLAFPVAHFLTTLPPRRVGVYMLFILLPFWTSLLVRTSAWIVMLQREGPLNQFLQWTGLTSTPLELLYNRTSVLIVMTHVLLPFMILSIYANMLAIPRDYVRAARSLGGGPISIFFRIYLPQTMPGIGAGCLLVFILALGYYVTPALVGGPRDQMLSSYIAFYTNQTINWGLASALGLVLLMVSGLSYLVITGLTRTRGPLERMWMRGTSITMLERCALALSRVLSYLVFLFLVLPFVVVIPLSFSSTSMLNYPLPGLSWRWYERFFTLDAWQTAIFNSLYVAGLTVVVSTVLGTLAALGLQRCGPRMQKILALAFVAPMMVPVVLTAVGLFFFFASLGMVGSYAALILSHTIIATPFVVIAVSASLAKFDKTLVRAAQSLGSGPVRTFFSVTMPSIFPGLMSGALFAFAASLDELIITLFIASPEQRTIPRQMFSGVRENIEPTIIAAAAVMTIVSVALMSVSILAQKRDAS
jgi:putative spermidine/putrescine transport system permease protein